MDVRMDYEKLKINVSERKPNRYAAHALMTVMVTLLVACLMNEVGIFDVERRLIWHCTVLSLLACIAALYLAYSKKWSVDPRTKFVIISISLLLTLAVLVFLNNNVTLLLIFPMLLATRYRSRRVSFLAVTGSAVCSLAAPVLSWHLGTWSQVYLRGYLETMCGVSILETGVSSMTTGTALFNIVMYMSLPQLLVILIFGTMIMSITGTGIRSLNHQVENMKLSVELSQELEHVLKMQDLVLYGLADIIENRDVTTGDHVKRTSNIVRILVEAMHQDKTMHLSESFCVAVVKAAPLHDIGKIAVDDAILRKPGKLTPEEREMIQKHSAKSAEMIHRVLSGVEDENFMRIAENLALYHHEWYDGSGYPEHLRGADIPLEARIMAIADVYDALVSKRSYKEAVDHAEAFRIIEDAMGTQFDPALNPYFVAVFPQIQAYYEE